MTREEDITAAVEAALRVVEAAGVPEDLRGLAFQKAFDTLTGEGANAGVSSGVSTARPGPTEQGNGPAAQAAIKLRVEPQLVERVLDFDEDGVHIMVPRSRFADQKSVAIQQVATLIVAARQAGGLDDEWTLVNHVRLAAEKLGVEDPSNFATHIKRLQGVRARGSGKTGELKMNAVGFEAAGRLISSLAGEGGP